MPRIFMKEFSDIAVSAGTQKISKIKREKNKSAYHPYQDYYKQIREAIISAHSKDFGIKHVRKVANECPNLNKKTNYVLISKNYISWLGKKSAEWFVPPRGTYKHSLSEIVLNPEIGLRFNGDDHVVKLYFSEDKLSQNRANYMIYLMQEVFTEENVYHVLDIRRKKLFSATGNPSLFHVSIDSEIASLETAWESV